MRSGREKLLHGRRVLRAFTILEVVISILIIMVLVNGVLGYQYFSTRDVKLSEVQASAGRLGQLLLESWKGSGGGSFDPVVQFETQLDIETVANGPSTPEDPQTAFVKHGSWGVQFESVYFFVTLSKADATEQKPAILNAVVAWRPDYAPGPLDGTESSVRFSSYMFVQ